MIRILGVDPGSRRTGYGCIDVTGNQLRLVSHGTLKAASTSGRQEVPLEDRLLSIFEGLGEVIRDCKPTILSIERAFFAKNAASALSLGQARGVALLAGRIAGLTIAEYSPSEVKQALCGNGQADKDQVARAVQLLVGKQIFDTADASDGLALAICHAYAGRPGSVGARRPSAKRRSVSLAEAVGLIPLKR